MQTWGMFKIPCFSGEFSLIYINPVVCDGWVLSDVVWFTFIFRFNNLLYLLLKYATKENHKLSKESSLHPPDFTPTMSWGSVWKDE